MKDNEMPLGERGFWYEKGDGGNFIRADPDAHIDVFGSTLLKKSWHRFGYAASMKSMRRKRALENLMASFEAVCFALLLRPPK